MKKGGIIMKTITINLIDYIEHFEFDIHKTSHLTGHMYYMSPYETDDACGNCDGAKCDHCRMIYTYEMWKAEPDLPHTMADVPAVFYLPDYDTVVKWQKEIAKAIQEEQHEPLHFNFLQEEFVFNLFTVEDLKAKYPELFEDVYLIKHLEKKELLIFDDKEIWSNIRSVIDRSICSVFTDVAINYIGKRLYNNKIIKVPGKQ
jgi:hypothetical protein